MIDNQAQNGEKNHINQGISGWQIIRHKMKRKRMKIVPQQWVAEVMFLLFSICRMKYFIGVEKKSRHDKILLFTVHRSVSSSRHQVWTSWPFTSHLMVTCFTKILMKLDARDRKWEYLMVRVNNIFVSLFFSQDGVLFVCLFYL